MAKRKKTVTKGIYEAKPDSKSIVDVITVKGSKVRVYAMKGNDQVTIAKGNYNEIRMYSLRIHTRR